MPSVNAFPHVISVLSKSTANDGSGGQSATYTTAYGRLPAWVQPASAGRKNWYLARDVQITHSIYVGKALTLGVGAVVTFGARQFYVTGWRNLLEQGRVFQLDCREVATTELIIQD